MQTLTEKFLATSAVVAGLFVFGSAQPADAAQQLSLRSLTGLTTGSIVEGSVPPDAPLQLDLYLSTDHSVSAMEYYVDVSGAPVNYATPVIEVLGAPSLFTTADLGVAPVAGTPVARGDFFEGVTGWIKDGSTATDEYPAFTAPIARYTFDVSQLVARDEPYVFTPVFTDYLAADLSFVPTYDAPDTFALTVTSAPIPEPISFASLGLALISLASVSRPRRTK